MSYSLKALRLHAKLRGKLAVHSKVNLKSKENLCLAYTPGVAEITKEIQKNKAVVYDLTTKHNTVAVVTDGSAVLGLGNVGAEAALPVMEGKCAIFKTFAGLNAWPICLLSQDVDEIVSTVKNISSGFGAINLEDISAPRCFVIEQRLQTLPIPVMHDDQHATAIAVLAGLFNAVKVANKKLDLCKIVVVGCGAAGTAIAKLLSFIGAKNIIMVDRHGILSRNRQNLPKYKQELALFTNKENVAGDLKIAAKNADILIGVSTRGIFTKKLIDSLNKNPIIFALANPDPEMTLKQAKEWGVGLFATGRSDYPNQINNALVFPGLFKGLLKRRGSKITNDLKVKVAQALASLVTKSSPNFIIPSIFDKRVVPTITNCVK